MRLGVTPQGTRVARNVGIPLAFSLVASLVGFYVISSVWSSCDSQPNENVSFLFAATVGGPAIFFTSILVLSIASTLLRNATARLYYPAIASSRDRGSVAHSLPGRTRHATRSCCGRTMSERCAGLVAVVYPGGEILIRRVR